MRKTVKYRTLFWVFIAAIAGAIGTAAWAQDAEETTAEEPAPAEAAAPTDDAGGDDVELIQLIGAGGWAMWPLGFLSVCGVGLVIYNFIVIRKKPFLVPDVVETLKDHMENLRLEEAKVLCEENPSPVTNILYAGLDRVSEDHVDPEAMEKAMEDSSTEELAAPFIMINYLSIVATLSPMVGLLGTVSGMVKAFRNISAQGMGNPELLAENISEALITTASGLIIAIPAMFFYSFFKNRYGKLVSSVSKVTGDLFFRLIAGIRRQTGQ